MQVQAYVCCVWSSFEWVHLGLSEDVVYRWGPSKWVVRGDVLGAVALDADNHLFDVAYAAVSGETSEEWEWFLQLYGSA